MTYPIDNQEYKYSVEFIITQTKYYSITVKSWFSPEYKSSTLHLPQKWNWNYYINIFDKSEVFDKIEPDRLHMHGGTTYDEIITFNDSKTRKIGCDYGHYYDYDKHPSPLEGIPYYVLYDVKKLQKQVGHLFKNFEETGIISYYSGEDDE